MMSILQKFSIESLVSGNNQLSSSLFSNTSTHSFGSALSTSPDPTSSFAQFPNFLRVSPLNSLSMLTANNNTVPNNRNCYQDDSSSVLEEIFEARGRNQSSASPTLSDENGAADTDLNLLLSGYTSCGSSTAGADEVFGCEGVKPARDERPPIRQTLSYLDVIFPHIQMICANIDFKPLSQQHQSSSAVATDEMNHEEMTSASVTSASALTGDRKMPKEWLELIRHSFFNFPCKKADSQENCGKLASGLALGQLSDAFFFQQMQKSKRNRTAFSTQQLDQLEQAFCSNHYVIGNERKKLAECLNLSETQASLRTYFPKMM